MTFHTYGNEENKTAVFVHGLLSPWQIWEPVIEKFKQEYFVIVPELDAHTEDEVSAFRSVEDEAKTIAEYIRENREGKIDILAGLSMGGRIAATLAGITDIRINDLVLDGAPLLPLPKIFIKIMENNYIAIIRRSKKRDPKVIENFKRDFLPEIYLDPFLKLADNMEEESLRNILSSVFSPFEFKRHDDSMRILCMHGTRSNEVLAAKSARRMKEINPQTNVKIFKDYKHAQLLCNEPSKWSEEVNRWLRTEA